jgi:Cys-tRNA(Pro)/Cys-tRNA(Cys) deacylase
LATNRQQLVLRLPHLRDKTYIQLSGMTEPKMIKTNAVRVLDRLGIRYELPEHEVDPDDLSAGAVAEKTGIPPEQHFKTLAVQGDRNGICLAVIPATEELDFKALAHQTGDRKVDMVPLKEVQTATGYIRGGVMALACKKDYPAFIDELAEICDVISVSAGKRGLQILLTPQDYICAFKARVVDITKGETSSD